MPNRDGIVSIGFDYKKDLEKMIKDFESEMNAVSSNTQLSKGMKKQFDNILAEMRDFKSSMDKELANLGSGKVSQSSFKSFKQTVENKFKGIREDIDRLDLALNNLNTSIGILGNGFNLSKFSNEFEEARQRVLSTNEAIDILFSKLDNQGISLFSIDNASLNESLDIIKKIERAIKTVDSESSDKYDLKILKFDEKEAQSEADKISATIEFIKDKMDSLNEAMNNPDIGGIKLTKIKAEYEALSLELKKVYDKMNAFYNIDISKVNFDPVFSDKAVSIFEDISEEFDGEIEKFIQKARLAKKELKDLVDYSKGGTVKISNKLDANTSQVETTATIRTTSKDLWKILEPELDKLQKTLNSNPVVAPVKLVVAPASVSSAETGNLDTSNAYSKKYQKILAQTGEDAVVDLEGVYKKTFTSVMDTAVSYAKETIGKIQEVFDKNLIGVKFDISQEEIDKIQNFVLSNKDGKKVDISGQITKAKQEVEELNESIEKTAKLLDDTKSKGNVKFDGFDKFTQDVSKSIGKLEELQNILKALQNIEITLAKASGIASITELDNQWANVEKRILNATKLDGSFRKNASVSKIASEYQKYIDMGGTNSISDISKIKENKDTIDAIISKAKEFQKQDFTNDSIDKLSVDLDGVIAKFDELISTVKTATNALYKIIKQGSVSDLDKQWSSISNKFKSIADESGKINLSKQKTDIKELMDMYQKYEKAGGTNSLMSLTDNVDTLRKLDKEYQKLNQTQSVDNSFTIEKESESFKSVEKSVNSLTTAIGGTKVQAINVEATAMEDAAEREIMAIRSILDNLDLVVSRLKDIKGIKLPKIEVKNVDVVEKAVESLENTGNKSNISSENITNQIVENEKKKQEAYKATADAVMYHAGVISKLNKAETNGRFYGSDRGTGYFGTGHYFVDSATKHELDNNSSYSKLPYTSIDISQYDNLFRATTNEIADGLHTFLKNLTKFTQGSDSFSVSELFSQFQKVFGETVMDMQEFDAKLEQLKTYMQNSNISDRGDSVSTQFMKSLGYGGVDTRGTKYADTRYGTVIYDLKEESILQANITDELQKQGQMLEKINYEKGQVFDKSEDTRIQGIIDEQNKVKEIQSEFEKLYDATQLRAYESELDSIDDKLSENKKIIDDCRSSIETADEDARRFAKDFADMFDDEMISDDEIKENADRSRLEYQERISELEEENQLLLARKSEIEANIESEAKLVNAARERAKAIVEERNKPIEDVFQGDKIDQATTSAKELDKTLEQVNIPTDSFDEVLSKLDLAKSELGEIVKITKQSVSDSEGKFHDSYTLKDSRGSTEIYGLSSNTEKGQLLRSNIVGYDAKEIEKETKVQQKVAEQEAKALNQAWEEANKVNNALNETKKTLSSLPRMTELDTQFTSLDTKLSSLNSELTSGKISVADYKKEVKSLTSEYSKLVTIQQNRDVETYNQNAKAAEQEAKAIERMRNELKSYNNQVPKKPADGQRSDKFESFVQNYKNAIDEAQKYLDNLGDSPITKEVKDEWERLIGVIKKAKEEMDAVPNAARGSDEASRMKEIDKLTKYLDKNTRISKEAREQLEGYLALLKSGDPSVNVKEIHTAWTAVAVAEREAGREGKSFLDIFKNKVVYNYAAQLAGYYLSFMDIIRYAKQGTDAVKEFDEGLTKISYTMDMTKSQFNDLGKSILDMASDMKTSLDDAMSVAQIYANMNTTAEEIQKLSEPTLILSNLTGFDASTVADDIQAVTQQFDILAEDSMHIADVYDYISRNISVDYSKGIESIAEAVQVAGSTAKQAGLEYEQLAAIVGKTAEKTRLEGSQIGNGLKTIMTRLSKVGELSDEVDNETMSDASESLHKIGIEVYNADGSFRQFDVIMGELANKWSDLTDAEKSNISFAIAATRQTNLLSAVLSNFSESMQLAEGATNANGSALENQQKYMDSFAGHLQSLETEAKIAWINILDSETLKGGVDLLTGLVKVVGQLVDKFGLLGTAGLVGGGILSKNGIG